MGRDVKMIMTSQDVIHSFYVPAFRIKQDVLPGRYTTAWFHATKPGTYHLFCAEYCGTQHSGMIGQIVVMEPARVSGLAERRRRGRYRWRRTGRSCSRNWAAPPATAPIRRAAGRTWWACSASRCSLEDGRTVIADENYIRESILSPGAKMVRGFKPIMPVFQGLVSEEQLNALVAYVKSLSRAQPERQAVRQMAPPDAQPQEPKVQ